jgi:hypothetical protein
MKLTSRSGPRFVVRTLVNKYASQQKSFLSLTSHPDKSSGDCQRSSGSVDTAVNPSPKKSREESAGEHEVRAAEIVCTRQTNREVNDAESRGKKIQLNVSLRPLLYLEHSHCRAVLETVKASQTYLTLL